MMLSNVVTRYPNGSVVTDTITGDPTTAGQPISPTNPATNIVKVTTIAKGPKGELPPGYPGAFPGATVL